jgi:hypothetical protein
MGSLGDFGTIKPKVVDTFGWFGTEVRVNPALSDLVLMDFADEAKDLDENSPEALGFVKRQMRLVIDPQDFDAFWSAAIANRQDSVDLMTVMKRIIESTAKRPTLHRGYLSGRLILAGHRGLPGNARLHPNQTPGIPGRGAPGTVAVDCDGPSGDRVDAGSAGVGAGGGRGGEAAGGRLTLAEICDVTEAIWTDELRERVLVERQVIAARMARAEEWDTDLLPDVDAAMAKFAEWLVSDPESGVSTVDARRIAVGLERG